jgi:prolyl oligopeptidase PreP (S9A serine peptidase family)
MTSLLRPSGIAQHDTSTRKLAILGGSNGGLLRDAATRALRCRGGGGDHDTRVMPIHSFKFVASLQTAQAGPAPVLLFLEGASGHGGGRTTSQAIQQNASIYAFLREPPVRHRPRYGIARVRI